MADDEKPINTESLAQTMVTIVRMSELLNIPVEDATTLFLKISKALGIKKPS